MFTVCCSQQGDQKFVQLGSPKRIWAVPAIHGESRTLISLHDKILDQFKRGDKLVYLGNYIGHGEDAAGTVSELLAFRRLVLSIQGVYPADLIYLRGSQEEMLQKLLQLQFAPNPTDVLLWTLGQGMTSTLNSYGLCQHDAIEACSKGTMGITKWTALLRQAIKDRPGHDTFFAQLTRAAYTDERSSSPLLFVHAGLDYDCRLEDQGDTLWWGAHKFQEIKHNYAPFKKVIRGYDPQHKGLDLNCVKATLDEGCGFGGQLICAAFTAYKNQPEILSA